jgi:hypothetical protein
MIRALFALLLWLIPTPAHPIDDQLFEDFQ